MIIKDWIKIEMLLRILLGENFEIRKGKVVA